MGIGLTIVLIILILGAFITLWLYMYQCAENEIGMFTNPKYEERISDLERIVEELRGKE